MYRYFKYLLMLCLLYAVEVAAMKRRFTGSPVQQSLSIADTVAQAGRFMQSSDTYPHARSFYESAVQQQPRDQQDREALDRAQLILADMLTNGLGGPADRPRSYRLVRHLVYSSSHRDPLLLNNSRGLLAHLLIEDRATLATLTEARELLRAILNAPEDHVLQATRDRAEIESHRLRTIRPLNEQLVPVFERLEIQPEPGTNLFDEHE